MQSQEAVDSECPSQKARPQSPLPAHAATRESMRALLCAGRRLPAPAAPGCPHPTGPKLAEALQPWGSSCRHPRRSHTRARPKPALPLSQSCPLGQHQGFSEGWAGCWEHTGMRGYLSGGHLPWPVWRAGAQSRREKASRGVSEATCGDSEGQLVRTPLGLCGPWSRDGHMSTSTEQQ